MSGYGGCSTSLSNNCGDAAPTFPQSSKAFPQYAVLGFLFIFVMAVFIVIFLIRTRQLCMDIRNQQDANLHLGAHRTSRSQASETALPVNPVEPLLRAGQGLDAAFIQTLPLFSYKKGGFPDSAGLKGQIGDCSVCLNEYQEGEGVRLLPGCNHVFHQECVDTWLLSHTSCPICRSNIQVKKQSSLRRMLSLLSGRYQIDGSQDGGSNGNNPGLAVTLTVVSQDSAPPPAPSAESQAGQDTAASASGTEERTQLPVGEISQAAREGSFVGEHVAIVVASEHSGELESEQEAERRILGSNRKRRPGSEDIRWAAPDATGLESVTPRPVKRAFSLGREQASVGFGSAPLSISYDRRHSFTERLRNSMRRDPSLLRSLSRPQALALQSGDSTAEAEASDHVVDLEAATTSSVSTT